MLISNTVSKDKTVTHKTYSNHYKCIIITTDLEETQISLKSVFD